MPQIQQHLSVFSQMFDAENLSSFNCRIGPLNVLGTGRRASWCIQCFDDVGWVAKRASGLSKTEWWDAGMVICLERGAHLHMAQLMSLPLTVSCFSKIHIGFTFLVLIHLGSPGKRAVKQVCRCVCVKWSRLCKHV